jgi:hypothetical protein
MAKVRTHPVDHFAFVIHNALEQMTQSLHPLFEPQRRASAEGTLLPIEDRSQ